MTLLTSDELAWHRLFDAQVLQPMQAVVRAAQQQGIRGEVHRHGPLMASLSLYPAGSIPAVADFLIQRKPDGWLVSQMGHVQGAGRQRLEVAEELHAELPGSSWLLSALRQFVEQERQAGMLNPLGKVGSRRATRRAQRLARDVPPGATESSTRK